MTTTMRRVSSLHLPLQETFRHDTDAEFGRTICLYWETPAEDSPGPSRILWVDFEVFEAVGRGTTHPVRAPTGSTQVVARSYVHDDRAPLVYYATEDREFMSGLTADLDCAVWTVRGFVKFDGCTQVYFPGDVGPVHYDSAAGLRGLFGAICRAQERCYEIMDTLDE